MSANKTVETVSQTQKVAEFDPRLPHNIMPLPWCTMCSQFAFFVPLLKCLQRSYYLRVIYRKVEITR
jgi:hypothetical protein